MGVGGINNFFTVFLLFIYIFILLAILRKKILPSNNYALAENYFTQL